LTTSVFLSTSIFILRYKTYQQFYLQNYNTYITITKCCCWAFWPKFVQLLKIKAMITIEINEQKLRLQLNELIKLDEEIITDSSIVNENVTAFLLRLTESPEEFMAEIIADYIYAESFIEE
jgi:hypothetical protein